MLPPADKCMRRKFVGRMGSLGSQAFRLSMNHRIISQRGPFRRRKMSKTHNYDVDDLLSFQRFQRTAHRNALSFCPGLTCACRASQTPDMAHTYILFDFGADEEKLQQARHKLEGWKQAFRLDKKLQYKFDRQEGESSTPAIDEKPEKPDKQKPKSKAKSQSKASEASGSASNNARNNASNNGTVQLLVRLYFSPHEKLSEQRWIERIPSEEPFKGAAPKIIREDADEFSAVVEQFDRLN